MDRLTEKRDGQNVQEKAEAALQRIKETGGQAYE